MKSNPVLLPALAISSSLLATPALAHTSHLMESGLVSGLLHPLTGVDHLLAMLAVGIWAALQKGKATSLIPATFTLMLLAGFMLAVSGFALPVVEGGIAVSVMMLGLFIATTQQMKLAAALPIVGGFALFHGAAHGAEMGLVSTFAFATGFIASSLALQFAGKTSMTKIQNRLPLLHQAFGALTATLGALFLIA